MAFYGSPEALSADISDTELGYPHTPTMVENVVAVLASRQSQPVVYTPEQEKIMKEAVRLTRAANAALNHFKAGLDQVHAGHTHEGHQLMKKAKIELHKVV